MVTEVVLTLIGGLVLFLFAVTNLSDVSNELAGEKTRYWLQKFTTNTFTGIISGLVLTAILGSSSAVIIITIVLVKAKVLSFREAMGVVLGANIGTTVSSQIIAFDLGRYAPIFMIIGLVLILTAAKSKFRKGVGSLFLYFGMLFFGLNTMGSAVEPLKEHPKFFEWLAMLDNPLSGVLAGGVITAIIQASSATVGMAIVLGKKGVISLIAGVSVMMGAELGTCADTLLATINSSKQALKTGLFHLIFNIISIITGLILIHPFVNLVEFISTGMPLERKIANAHMLFNILGVVIFAWFIPLFDKLLTQLIPEKP